METNLAVEDLPPVLLRADQCHPPGQAAKPLQLRISGHHTYLNGQRTGGKIARVTPGPTARATL